MRTNKVLNLGHGTSDFSGEGVQLRIVADLVDNLFNALNVSRGSSVSMPRRVPTLQEQCEIRVDLCHTFSKRLKLRDNLSSPDHLSFRYLQLEVRHRTRKALPSSIVDRAFVIGPIFGGVVITRNPLLPA